MEFDTGRRRFLELAGTGTALSLAGCSAVQDSVAPGSEEPSDGEKAVAIAVSVDQQKMQQRQQEIRSEFDSGNITRKEAQERYQTVQTELRKKAVASFTEQVKSDSELTIKDSVDQFGVVLVTGPATGLIDLLSETDVQGLFPKATFQRAKQQAGQQRSTPSSNTS